jgi:hypothetical protein
VAIRHIATAALCGAVGLAVHVVRGQQAGRGAGSRGRFARKSIGSLGAQIKLPVVGVGLVLMESSRQANEREQAADAAYSLASRITALLPCRRA